MFQSYHASRFCISIHNTVVTVHLVSAVYGVFYLICTFNQFFCRRFIDSTSPGQSCYVRSEHRTGKLDLHGKSPCIIYCMDHDERAQPVDVRY